MKCVQRAQKCASNKVYTHLVSRKFGRKILAGLATALEIMYVRASWQV